MRYLLLIHKNLAELPYDSAEYVAGMESHAALRTALEERGALLAAGALQPADTATTLRPGRERTEFTDGPFIETHEQLAGFYLIECRDLDEAIAYAKQIPGATADAVEIRALRAAEPGPGETE